MRKLFVAAATLSLLAGAPAFAAPCKDAKTGSSSSARRRLQLRLSAARTRRASSRSAAPPAPKQSNAKGGG